MPEHRNVMNATADNFTELVLENSRKGPVLVHYWAPWAGPCMQLKPLLARLVEDYGGRFLLVEINTDEQKPLARQYNVTSIPFLKIFRNGEPVHDFHGGQAEAEFRRVLDRFTGRDVDPRHAAAVRAFREGDVEEAIALFEKAVTAMPDDARIRLHYAKVLLGQGLPQEAARQLEVLPDDARQDLDIADMLAHVRFALAAEAAPERSFLKAAIETDPDDCASRFGDAALCLREDDFDGALAQLLEILRREPAWNGGAARPGMLAVFRMLGDQHALVQRYRRELLELPD